MPKPGEEAMRKPEFTVAIEGPGAAPDTVSIDEVMSYLKKVETAILETARDMGLELPDDAYLCLVRVEAGSDALVCATNRALMPAMSRLSNCVHKGRWRELPVRAHDALREAARLAQRKSRAIALREDKRHGIAPARFGADAPVPEREAIIAQEYVTVYGMLERIGGAEPKAVLRIMTQDTSVSAGVTREIAKTLGAKLYREVGVEGWARVDVERKEILELKIEKILPYERIDHEESRAAIDELRDAVGDEWSSDQAIALVHELRGYDERPGAPAA